MNPDMTCHDMICRVHLIAVCNMHMCMHAAQHDLSLAAAGSRSNVANTSASHSSGLCHRLQVASPTLLKQVSINRN